MPTFGGSELWIILLIVLVLFGGAKIPQMMKGLGEGMKEFKKATRDEETERRDSSMTTNPPSSTSTDIRS